MALVSFTAFAVEFKKDFATLCQTYPPGPTLQDLVDWYGETTYRCNRVINYYETRGLVKRISGPGKRILIVPYGLQIAFDDYRLKLTEIQHRVLKDLQKLSEKQGSKRVAYSILSISDNVEASKGAVRAALTRLRILQLVEFVGHYDPHKHSSVLDLKIDH